jgi:hypothetical protein
MFSREENLSCELVERDDKRFQTRLILLGWIKCQFVEESSLLENLI